MNDLSFCGNDLQKGLEFVLPENSFMKKSQSSKASEATDKPRIAFVSTRIAGTDGVSLEIEKWARVLERMGVECYYIAGELDRPQERCVLIKEAHFNHAEVLEVSRRAFDAEV